MTLTVYRVHLGSQPCSITYNFEHVTQFFFCGAGARALPLDCTPSPENAHSV
jgi:hypothetical protein